METLQLMPKATRQFFDPIGWHRQAKSVGSFRHYDFRILYDDAPLEYLADPIRDCSLSVIFLQTRFEGFLNIIRDQKDRCLVLSHDTKLGMAFCEDARVQEIYCKSVEEFFLKTRHRIASMLQRESDDIEKMIEMRVDELKRTLDATQTRAEADFRACAPNDHTFLQLIAPYGTQVLEPERVEHSKRSEALVASAKRVLNAYSFVTARSDDREHKWPDYLPPLIVTWPYYGPTHRDLFKSEIQTLTGIQRDIVKTFKEVAFAEQDPETYDFNLTGRQRGHPDAILTAVGEFKVKMTAYLDNVSYLHASFQDSPVLRMPLTVQSVNEALGSFQKSCIGLNRSSKRASVRLRRCGELLGSRFPKPFLPHIDQFYDQMVAITDIPIEWTICDGVPLGFILDVCRLPQSSPSSVMAQFASNTAFGYSVKSNILAKTLVICGADPADPVGRIFDSVAGSLSESEGVSPVAIRCLNKAEFVNAIEEHKPDFLIVDSHGSFTPDEGSYLSIGNERVTGNDVVRIQHAIPLVMLSCCLSAPLYGCSNTIAQAFFEAGSRSVLSTFLPISSHLGYLLYQRILRNLAFATKESCHRNWLSFISHNLRTSHFDDYMWLLRSALGEMEDLELVMKSRTHWMVNSMHPAKRREVYFATKEAAINSFPPTFHERARAILNSQSLISEAFYYTHLGRADLVHFDVALEEKTNKDPKAKILYEEITAQGCL